MSWRPRTLKKFASVALTASVASVATWLAFRRDNDVNRLPELGSQGWWASSGVGCESGSGSGSGFNLGKVLASWTTNFKPSVPWDNNWDRRDPKTLVKPPKKSENSSETDNDYQNKLKQATPTASRHLLFIRHGQYLMEPDTDHGRILTKLGRDQADCTGKRLAELDLPYTTVINSTMARAKETSDLVHKYLSSVPRKECDMLREGAPIPPEPPIGNWRPEASQFFTDGARIEAAFRRYFHRADPSQEKDSYEVIVCHANVIRYFVCRALQFPPEAWLRMSLHHGSITRMVIRPSGRVSIQTLGDSGHLPSQMLTTS